MGYTMAMEANAMENQKLFEEFPYKRPDLDQLKEEFRDLTQKLRNAEAFLEVGRHRGGQPASERCGHHVQPGQYPEFHGYPGSLLRSGKGLF